MFDLFKRRKGRGARRRATPSMFAEFLEYFGEAPVLEDGAADPYDAFIDGLGGMAHGLFASLLIGCIINTIGMYVPLLKDIVVNPWMSDKLAGENLLIASKTAAYAVQGAAMAAAIAYSMKAPPFVMYSTLAVGFAANALGAQGGPLAVFFVVVIAVFFGKLVSKRTPIDIIVTPFVTIVFGVLFAFLIAPPIGKGAVLLGDLVMKATALQPFWMGILVSALMGIILTLPISSAAICAALGLTGLAGGAAVAGCCAQMIGFAVMSFPENRWGGLAAQGLGTSMLQMGNIVRNPRVWIPPTLASAITGPVATCLFRLEMNGAPVSSGMGTCGLVGQIGVYTGWVSDVASGAKAAITGMDWLGLVLISFVLPAVLTWLIAIPLRKWGWIKDGDLKLDL